MIEFIRTPKSTNEVDFSSFVKGKVIHDLLDNTEKLLEDSYEIFEKIIEISLDPNCYIEDNYKEVYYSLIDKLEVLKLTILNTNILVEDFGLGSITNRYKHVSSIYTEYNFKTSLNHLLCKPDRFIQLHSDNKNALKLRDLNRDFNDVFKYYDKYAGVLDNNNIITYKMKSNFYDKGIEIIKLLRDSVKNGEPRLPFLTDAKYRRSEFSDPIKSSLYPLDIFSEKWYTLLSYMCTQANNMSFLGYSKIIFISRVIIQILTRKYYRGERILEDCSKTEFFYIAMDCSKLVLTINEEAETHFGFKFEEMVSILKRVNLTQVELKKV